MEQIYQWFEYRKSNWWSFSLYLIKLLLKMGGWKEQEPETVLSSTPGEGGNSLTFMTGVIMSGHFLRPPNMLTKFFKNPKYVD